MNRFRINQILSVLLFPFGDPSLGKEDWLLQKFTEYDTFRQFHQNDLASMDARDKQFAKYQQACNQLQHYLEKKNEGRIKSYDDLLQLCELYYPTQRMRELTEGLRERQRTENVNGRLREWIALFYLKNLERIADSMITYRDGTAAIRTWNNGSFEDRDIFSMPHVFDKVEIWNLLCRFTVPDIYIVSFAVQSGMEIEALYEQAPFISLADKLLVKVLEKGIAENHLHFNVGFDYVTAWLYEVNPSGLCEKKRKAERLKREEVRVMQAAIFRCLAAAFLRDNGNTKADGAAHFWDWLAKTAGTKEHKQIVEILEEMDCGAFEAKENLYGILEMLVRRFNPAHAELDYDFLLETVYEEYAELKTSSEFILLYFCCRYIRSSYQDTEFAHLFLQYLRIKNALFQKSQQRYGVRGLRYFQNFYSASSQMFKKSVGPEGAMLEVFRAQAKITALKKLEIRISPAVNKGEMDCFQLDQCRDDIREQLSKQLRRIFSVYRRYILETMIGVQEAKRLLLEEKKETGTMEFSYLRLCKKAETLFGSGASGQVPTLGIVYHFLKRELLDNTSGYFCWREIQGDHLQYSNHGLIVRQHMVNVSVVIEELRSSIPGLAEYIVGIDAASDENAMEPWMFAPAYTQMRSRRTTKPIAMESASRQKYYNIQNVGFTYHVGEDFRHVLSGLRHMDEVIEHFYYKPGDRLGHAIALGIDIRKWAHENEVVALPAQEHMENLLWVWGKNVYDGILLPVQLEKLEEQIMKIAEKIYRCAESITIRMLYEAYQKKFFLNHKRVMERECDKFPKEAGKREEQEEESFFCYYSGKACKMTATGWSADKLLCTNYCPVFEERYKKVMLVTVPENEIAAYEILQEHLLEKVERKGIYVETNPTSNITIGDFDDFREHPVFRMNAIRGRDNGGHHVMVTINSDDPAVFQTNVENELAYVYYASEHSGCAREDVLEWIDKIRQNGLNASFIQKEKSGRQMLYEISRILDELR
ncbi:MAG: hypothetical protein Q4C58_12940 [Eubacteriales bacterium]|nr:hypothetical protein [Eubacteriales bacterium]